jgi:DNA primase
MSSIDEVKARLDIVELVSESVQLRHSGKNYTGFCPFHSNSRTPAFVVFPESGTWRCFGQCNEGGDIFSFVMKKEGWDFAETLRYLAEKAGIELKPPSPQEQAAVEEGDHLRNLLEEAVVFYRHQLLNTPPGKAAQAYLHQRGVKDETIESFGLGYAPHSWDAALRYFKSKGYSEKILLDAGLLTERGAEQGGERASVYDRFRNRLMFPIRDERGRMAGFGARILDPEDIPKFLNSPQTPIFDKSHLLYGLDAARKAIRAMDQAVIVEGYLDVIALHQAGFANTVSPMGTALTERQLYLLKRYTRRIVLALDPDAAGSHATLRGLQIARQALDHEQELIFDARGLLSFESRLQADIRVTTLPEGMDPDDVVNRDPDEWRRILEDAKPIVQHVIETLAAQQDVDDPKVKREIAGQVLPLIDDLPSPIERDTYRQRLARMLRVDERSLTGEARSGRSRSARRTQPARSARPADAKQDKGGVIPSRSLQTSYALEAHALGVLLRRPDLLFQVDRQLQESGLGRLSLEDFQHGDHRTILRVLLDSIDQDIAEPLTYVLNSLSLEMMEVADGLLGRSAKLDPNDERVIADLIRSIIDVRQRNLKQFIDHLRYLLEEAQQKDDRVAAEYAQIVVDNSRIIYQLNKAKGKYSDRVILSR